MPLSSSLATTKISTNNFVPNLKNKKANFLTPLKFSFKQLNKQKSQNNLNSEHERVGNDKTEKPPHTYITLIAKAIQVLFLNITKNY